MEPSDICTRALTEHGDIFSRRFPDVRKLGIEVSKRENLCICRIYQLRVIVAKWLDVLQLIEPLLLFDIGWAGESIGCGLVETPLYRQVRLHVLWFDGLGASGEVWAEELE